MAKWIWGLGIALALAHTPDTGAAAAQNPTCDQRQRVIGHLADRYKEAPVAIGVTNAGGLVEVLSTGDGQTWTIIVSNPDGLTCLLATGEGWRAIHSDRTQMDPRV